MSGTEIHVIGKSPDGLCEDGVVNTDAYVAVIDGATSKSNMRYGGLRGGRAAMLWVSQLIASMPADYALNEAVNYLTAGIWHRYEQLGVVERVSADATARLTCSVVIYSRMRRQVWMIGDCQFRYEGCTHTNEKPADRILAGIRADVLRATLLRGNTVDSLRRNDVGRACILDALCLQCQFQNAPEYNPYSFVVLDGFPIDISRVPVYVLPPATDVPLILASDGYPELCDTFEATELRLRRMLHADPLCMEKYVATKGWMEGYSSFDDRTYVRFYPG